MYVYISNTIFITVSLSSSILYETLLDVISSFNNEKSNSSWPELLLSHSALTGFNKFENIPIAIDYLT